MTTLDRCFEKFTGGPLLTRRPVNEPRATLNSQGHIYMNAFLYERLGRPEAVTLYYSRADDAIAIEPALRPDHQSFPVRAKGRGWAIFAWPFCRHYGLRVPATVRFYKPEVSDGILVLNLREAVPIGIIGPRKREPASVNGTQD